MPYGPSRTLPGEHASRLGHLDVLKSPLVNRICESFEDPLPQPVPKELRWAPIPDTGSARPLVFAVDGSLQVVAQDRPPYRAIAFVKTALLRLDRAAIARVDPREPHPYAVRDVLTDAALYHATALPLRHVVVSGFTTYDLVRQTVFESMRDASLNGEPLETLRWLAYRKWRDTPAPLSASECPHCLGPVATLPYDALEGSCPSCGGHLFLTDWLGFHRDMAPDAADDVVASAYMAIHEALLLFTAVRIYWESQRDVLRRAVFIKDGPLTFFSQFAKLVNPVRDFLADARAQGYPVALVGQEKSGRFHDHLQVIGRAAPEMSFFLPGDAYIKTQVQHRPLGGKAYGEDTNYGAKLFVRLHRDDLLTLNVATGNHVADPNPPDLMCLADILATLPALQSARYTGALLPIALVNDVVSLSTYPSAKILKVFSETTAAARGSHAPVQVPLPLP
jgi:hypothetical protein